MPLSYFQGDELPYWQPTVLVNGETYDFSSGWSFEVSIAQTESSTVLLSKTTNITGSAAGVVTVAWATSDLTMSPGVYVVQLTGTRSSDNAQFTLSDTIAISDRLKA